MIQAKKKYGFSPDYAICPGKTLKETMESMGMTQKELAQRTGLTVQSINRIFKGQQPINYETANRLELVTGTPARFWNNLEAKYREQLEKIQELENLKSNIEWLKSLPVGEIQKRGLISNTQEKAEQIREVLKFFGVSSLSAWNDIWTSPKVAARRSPCFESQPEHAATWIRMGELIAHRIPCEPFNKNLFRQSLQTIRKLTIERPEDFIPEMKNLCSKAGVAISFVPEMPKVPWNGATKWLNPNKAMIVINLRGKAEDKFWFSFFHEAGHVVNDNKKNLYINDNSDDPIENRANEYARNILFPGNCWTKIPSLTSRDKIIKFAKKINLSPGIVAGQFQYQTKKWGWYKNLIRKFIWNDK